MAKINKVDYVCRLSFAQGFVPFFVSATAGTTVYGAFDPLIAISDICKKYNVWMHVDVSQRESLLMMDRNPSKAFPAACFKMPTTASRCDAERQSTGGTLVKEHKEPHSSHQGLTNLLDLSRLQRLAVDPDRE